MSNRSFIIAQIFAFGPFECNAVRLGEAVNQSSPMECDQSIEGDRIGSRQMSESIDMMSGDDVNAAVQDFVDNSFDTFVELCGTKRQREDDNIEPNKRRRVVGISSCEQPKMFLLKRPFQEVNGRSHEFHLAVKQSSSKRFCPDLFTAIKTKQYERAKQLLFEDCNADPNQVAVPETAAVTQICQRGQGEAGCGLCQGDVDQHHYQCMPCGHGDQFCSECVQAKFQDFQHCPICRNENIQLKKETVAVRLTIDINKSYDILKTNTPHSQTMEGKQERNDQLELFKKVYDKIDARDQQDCLQIVYSGAKMVKDMDMVLWCVQRGADPTINNFHNEPFDMSNSKFLVGMHNVNRLPDALPQQSCENVEEIAAKTLMRNARLRKAATPHGTPVQKDAVLLSELVDEYAKYGKTLMNPNRMPNEDAELKQFVFTLTEPVPEPAHGEKARHQYKFPHSWKIVPADGTTGLGMPDAQYHALLCGWKRSMQNQMGISVRDIFEELESQIHENGWDTAQYILIEEFGPSFVEHFQIGHNQPSVQEFVNWVKDARKKQVDAMLKKKPQDREVTGEDIIYRCKQDVEQVIEHKTPDGREVPLFNYDQMYKKVKARRGNENLKPEDMKFLLWSGFHGVRHFVIDREKLEDAVKTYHGDNVRHSHMKEKFRAHFTTADPDILRAVLSYGLKNNDYEPPTNKDLQAILKGCDRFWDRLSQRFVECCKGSGSVINNIPLEFDNHQKEDPAAQKDLLLALNCPIGQEPRGFERVSVGEYSREFAEDTMLCNVDYLESKTLFKVEFPAMFAHTPITAVDFYSVAGYSYFDHSHSDGNQHEFPEAFLVLNYLDLPSEPVAQWNRNEESKTTKDANYSKELYQGSQLQQFARKGLAATVILYAVCKNAGSNSFRMVKMLNQWFGWVADKESKTDKSRLRVINDQFKRERKWAHELLVRNPDKFVKLFGVDGGVDFVKKFMSTLIHDDQFLQHINRDYQTFLTLFCSQTLTQSEMGGILRQKDATGRASFEEFCEAFEFDCRSVHSFGKYMFYMTHSNDPDIIEQVCELDLSKLAEFMHQYRLEAIARGMKIDYLDPSVASNRPLAVESI